MPPERSSATCVLEVDSAAIGGAPEALDGARRLRARRRLVLEVALRAAVGFAAASIIITGLAWLGVFGAPGSVLDVGLLQGWGRDVLLGQIPYRDFELEYPPLGLATFVLPSLIVGADAVEGYRLTFQVLMAACGVALAYTTVVTVGVLGGNRRELIAGGALAAATPLLMGPITLARYDLFPALLTGLALWSVATRRDTAAAIFVGLGTAAKLYPLLLAPFVVAYLWRRDGPEVALRWCLVLAVVLLLAFGPFLVLAPEGTMGMLLRTLGRPLQIEAFGAVILMLFNEVTGLPVRVVHTFDSWNLAGRAPDLAGRIQTLASVALVGVVFAGFLRLRPTRRALLLGLAAAICVHVALGKVLSPQYVIWLMPFIAVLPVVRGGLVAAWLLVAVFLLTSAYYPGSYWLYIHDRDFGWTLVILARNIALCALAAWLGLTLFRARSPATAARPGMREAIDGPDRQTTPGDLRRG